MLSSRELFKLVDPTLSVAAENGATWFVLLLESKWDLLDHLFRVGTQYIVRTVSTN